MKGGAEMPLLETLTNNASISFNLPNNIDIEFGATHYYNNWNKDNPSFLLGEASLKYSYRIFSFTLSCDNIFKKRNYVYSLSDGLTESTAIYRVRPRSVLLKIRCRIL